MTNEAAHDLAAQRRALAVSIASEAGALVRSRFGRPGRVLAKPISEGGSHVGDVVTEVDFASEQLIRERITAALPDAHVLGEEGGLDESAGQHPHDIDELWVVDPIDGTINFAHGIPGFCVSIGCYQKGRPVAGAIYDPMLDEMFSFGETNEQGVSAWCNDHPMSVAHNADLADSMLGAGGGGPEFRQIVRQFRSWRRIGSAALSMAWVAAGRFDAYVQLIALSPWDYGAGVPMILAAGGVATNEQLTPWQHPLSGTSGLVAASVPTHAQLTNLITQLRPDDV